MHSAKGNNSLKKISVLCAVFAFLIAGCSDSEAQNPENTQITENESLFVFEKTAARKITDGQDNFLVSFEINDGKISASVENKDFGASRSEIIPPEGYSVSDSPEDMCRIITDNTDNGNIPDIIELTFFGGDGKNVCRFYQIKDNALKEISLYNDGEKVPYIASSLFYRSERRKFIASIIVDESAGLVTDISDMVKIRTYTFDPDECTLTGMLEELVPENTLYFGYAYWGLANNTVRYFTDATLPVSDPDNYKEVSDGDNSPLFYFKTDDGRFPDTASLKEILHRLFKDDLADSIFENAPQKYRDFDGELYTLMGRSSHDPSLGMLTFSSYTVLEDGEKIIYSSRQEKYDDSGKFTGYVDGGDFTLKKQTDDDGNDKGWIITGYRYPYS